VSYEAKLESYDIKLEVKCNVKVRIDDPALKDLLASARNFYKAVAVRKIEFKTRQDGDFDYEIVAVDGRRWAQVMKITGSTDAPMNFDVSDFWRVTEFERHRAVRDNIVYIAVAYGLVELKLEWS